MSWIEKVLKGHIAAHPGECRARQCKETSGKRPWVRRQPELATELLAPLRGRVPAVARLLMDHSANRFHDVPGAVGRRLAF